MLLDSPTVLDALLHPDDTAAGLAHWAPQTSLVEVLDELTPASLSVDGRIDALVAVQRHIALLHAREAELLAAVDAGDSTVDGFTRDSVASAVRVPPASMRTTMTMARALTPLGRLGRGGGSQGAGSGSGADRHPVPGLHPPGRPTGHQPGRGRNRPPRG